MQASLFNVSQLSVELKRDRRSLSRLLEDVAPAEVQEQGAKTIRRYLLADVVDALVNNSSGLDWTAERARLAKEQADRTEMDNRARRDELIEASEVHRVVGRGIQSAKSRLLAIPSQLSKYLEHQEAANIQSQLHDAIYDALEELASQPFGHVEAAEAADSEPVGRRRKATKRRGKRAAGKVAD